MRSQRGKVTTMNYTVVGLVVILVITVTQYMVVRKQFAAYKAQNLVAETERSSLVQNLKDQVEPLKSQFETCKSERQKEAERTKKQVTDLEAQKNQLAADLDARTKEKDALAGVQQQKDALAGEKTALEEKVKSLEASVAKLNEDIKAAQAKTAEAEKQAADAKKQAEDAKKAAEAKKTPTLERTGVFNQTQDLAASPLIQPKLSIIEDPVVKSLQDKLVDPVDQRKELLDNEVPKGSLDLQEKPKSASVQPHLKFEDGGAIVKSLQHADQTKEQLDKEDVKSLKDKPGRIILDKKDRDRAQLPDVDPNAIEIKSIDKIEPEDRPGVGTTENILYEETEENDEDDSNPDDNYASTLTTLLYLIRVT